MYRFGGQTYNLPKSLVTEFTRSNTVFFFAPRQMQQNSKAATASCRKPTIRGNGDTGFERKTNSQCDGVGW